MTDKEFFNKHIKHISNSHKLSRWKIKFLKANERYVEFLNNWWDITYLFHYLNNWKIVLNNI